LVKTSFPVGNRDKQKAKMSPLHDSWSRSATGPD
jgi:hypothetical protein